VACAGDLTSTDARAALAELCTAYWCPIYALIRNWGHPADEAHDLTQAYFTHLLERRTLAAADPHKGRFRTFLRTDCGFFLADWRDRGRALKRGGHQSCISIGARTAEGRYAIEPSSELTLQRLFDHAWALTLLGQVLERIAAEYASSGRGPLFDQLQIVLTEGPRSLPYATIAAQLGMTEAAVQKAVSRLRRQYRELLCEHIANTLDDPSESAIEDEIRDLFNALAR
jgi:RNA polymerase sigma-70 factor (ECF subfamily)